MLQLWWAGLKERGKQPRLTGIEQNRSLNITEHWLKTDNPNIFIFLRRFNSYIKIEETVFCELKCQPQFKAALISILTLPMDQRMRNVKGVASGDKPTENYHPSSSQLYPFCIIQLNGLVLGHRTPFFWFSITTLFVMAAFLLFSKQALTNQQPLS